MNDKFLPVGTVCLLKKGQKTVMITGYGFIPESEKNNIYDYMGCLYPEGIISLEKYIVFNRDQIEQVVYPGYVSEAYELVAKKVDELVTKAKKDLISNGSQKNLNISNTVGEETEVLDIINIEENKTTENVNSDIPEVAPMDFLGI